jgi:hypothetical protein
LKEFVCDATLIELYPTYRFSSAGGGAADCSALFPPGAAP